MELALILLKQTLTMALYMLIGFALYKGKKIDKRGSGSIATMLVWAVIPAMIINCFCVENTPEHLKGFLYSGIVAIIAIAISLLISRLCFRNSSIDQFASSFSNAGFIGIPLVTAALGEAATFYLIGFIIFLNIGQWVLGPRMLCAPSVKVKKLTVADLVINPVVISSLVGLLIFISGVGTSLPSIISGCIKGVAGLNAPLAMIVLGVYLAQIELPSLVTTKRLYLCSAVRLILIPLVTLLILWPLPIDNTIKFAILIVASAPAGANAAVYSQIYGGDYMYACKTVTHSTILSIVTLPLVIMLAYLVF